MFADEIIEGWKQFAMVVLPRRWLNQLHKMTVRLLLRPLFGSSEDLVKVYRGATLIQSGNLWIRKFFRLRESMTAPTVTIIGRPKNQNLSF